MKKQKCYRCSTEEYIPTHQFIEVKIDYNVKGIKRDLCITCWTICRDLLYNKNSDFNKEPRPKRVKDSSYIIDGVEPFKERAVARRAIGILETWLLLDDKNKNPNSD